jgi:glycosyltransferase involved in cell wall biosynthesis
MLNILMIAQYFPPDVNGSSTRAYNAAKGLTIHGCNVTVITAFPHYPYGHSSRNRKGRGKIFYTEEIEGVRILRTWIPNLPHSPFTKRIILHIAFIFLSLFAVRYIRRVDVIFAMNPNLFAFFAALPYKILFRKQIIRNVDDLWPEVFYALGIVRSRVFKRMLDFVAGLSYRIPCAIIPVSQGYVDTLVTKYRVPKEKISVIEHGVDIMKFHILAANSSMEISNKKIVMYSGALNIGYNFETVVKSARILSHEPIHFILRGTGELSDRLRHIIRETGAKNIEIRTDMLSQEELVSLLNKADIFLLPMSPLGVIDQGLPTKILEYQALGKPIICISRGEAGRYILRTESGLVTDSEKPEDLARLISKVAADKQLAQVLGANGARNVRENLTLEIIGKRLLEVIEQIV